MENIMYKMTSLRSINLQKLFSIRDGLSNLIWKFGTHLSFEYIRPLNPILTKGGVILPPPSYVFIYNSRNTNGNVLKLSDFYQKLITKLFGKFEDYILTPSVEKRHIVKPGIKKMLKSG